LQSDFKILSQQPVSRHSQSQQRYDAKNGDLKYLKSQFKQKERQLLGTRAQVMPDCESTSQILRRSHSASQVWQFGKLPHHSLESSPEKLEKSRTKIGRKIMKNQQKLRGDGS